MRKLTLKERFKSVLNTVMSLVFGVLVLSLIFGIAYLKWIAHFQKFPNADWWTFFFK